ncbi:MAG TPA: hypothetical protein VJT31_04675 [Rugosimonospora sp.]|nr:hypothetical protein [Rugosimonospora sp.]
MRKTSLRNGAIVAASLAALLGVGTAIASAGTSSSVVTAIATASSSPGSSASPAPTGSPLPSATATASPTASSSSSGNSQCSNVYAAKAPAGDAVGKLCTVVTASGTTISKVVVTFTASSTCSGDVTLKVSGVDSSDAEFGKVSTVACSSGTASASFEPVSQVASGTDICGMLFTLDTYTAGEACVPIS